MLAESAYLSCAKMCIDDSRFSPDLYKDKRVTLNKTQKNVTFNSAAFITEDESSHVECIDQHHPTRPNDYEHGDSSD